MNNVWNWEEFGEFRVPSESEPATLDALCLSDEGMYVPMRPHLFVNRQLNQQSYFMFIVCRWRHNIAQRHLKTGGFHFSMHINDVLFKWLLRVENHAIVKSLSGVVAEYAVSASILDDFHSNVFDRLQRIFRLIVYSTNLINAARGDSFVSTTDIRPVVGEVNLQPTFYTRHVYDNLSKQRQFMAKKRKDMTNEDMIEFDVQYTHKAFRPYFFKVIK